MPALHVLIGPVPWQMTAAFRRGVASLISLGATTETKVKARVTSPSALESP